MNDMDTYIPSTFDNTSLSQLREDAKVDPDAKADEVSRQFEALFVNMLLKSMRKATQRSELFNSEAAKSFESMFDQEIANKVSYADGIGLANTIKRQLFPNNAQKFSRVGGFEIHQKPKAQAITAYQNQAYISRRIERD